MENFEQIKIILNSIKILVYAAKDNKISGDKLKDVQMASNEINEIFYHSEKLKFQKEHLLQSKEDIEEYVKEMEKIIEIWELTISRRNGKRVDIAFWKIYEMFLYVDTEQIFQMVLQKFNALPEEWKIEYLSLPHRYSFLTAKIDYTKNDYSLIEQYVNVLAEHVEDYRWLYEHLADFRSKEILNGIIRYWLDFDINRLYKLLETICSNYYDSDIWQGNSDSVFVDLGAYIGDSVLDYIETFGSFKKIYAYEITPSTYEILCKNTKAFENVIPLCKGVSDKEKIMYINGTSGGAGNKISEDGDTAVEVVTLDDDIQEPVSVIKMDIEGEEKAALVGAKRHIKNEKPILLISAYHLPEDIFEIPKLIYQIRDDYRFYIRFNGHGCLWPCDYVLFAV